MSTTLTLLTFEALADLAETRRAKASALEKIAGWDRLIGVARGLAANEGHDGDVLYGRTWRLTEVQIENYQGVMSMSPLVLDPRPGITVLRGDIGSGKSSVAEAIETALTGRPRLVTRAGGGNAPLWEREHCARGADHASVTVVLSDDSASGMSDRLVLSVDLDAEGRVIDRRAELRTATTTTRVDLTTTPWASMFDGHRPVFGYAAVERQVQVAKDLQGFLEPLLGLGGCFAELKRGVVDAASSSRAASQRWTAARDDARRAVARIDAEHWPDASAEVEQPDWPTVDTDPDDWMAASELTESGTSVPAVTDEQGRRFREAADGAVAALRRAEDGERSILARLYGPLRALDDQVSRLDDAGGECPVCRTEEEAWATTLRRSLDGLVDLDGCEASFASALTRLRGHLETDSEQIATVLGQSWFDADIAAEAGPVLGACRELRDVLSRDGARSTPAVREALRKTASALETDAWTRVMSEVVSRSDRRRQWLRARRAAVEPFVGVWRTDGAAAREETAWSTAEKYCMKQLLGDVRRERGRSLEQLIDDSVQALLYDAGIRVVDLSIQETKADIGLVDSGGSAVDLSMLSAGQRNVLLLAPLLGISRDGPFGFLVLDDPVHAFDQVRVDLLSRIVAELAATRRVVVLTHDERLKEHLLAHCEEPDVREVVRDHATGVVTVSTASAAWSDLLDDANAALDRASDSNERTTVTPTDLVRGFCRMAVDDAVRGHVVHVVTRAGGDVRSAVDRLDHVSTTAMRLDVAEELGIRAVVQRARSIIGPFERAWNRAAHGNPAESEATREEVRAARRACRALAGLG